MKRIPVKPNRYDTGRISHFDICASYVVSASGSLGEIPAEHTGLEVAHYLSEGCKMRFRGKEERVPPFKMMVLNGLETHTEIYHSDEDKLSRAVVFSSKFTDSLLSATGIHTDGLFFHNSFPSLSSQITSLMNELFEERARKDSFSASFDCLASELVLELLKTGTHSHSSKLSCAERQGNFPDPFLKARHILREKVLEGENIDLESLTNEVGITKFEFIRKFKQFTNFTPRQYLIRLRIDRAKHMLQSTDRLITDIAFSVGFGDLSGFNRTFKALTGKTPFSYRQSR